MRDENVERKGRLAQLKNFSNINHNFKKMFQVVRKQFATNQIRKSHQWSRFERITSHGARRKIDKTDSAGLFDE